MRKIFNKNNTKKKYPVKMGNRENDMKKKYPMKMKNLENEEINIYNAKKSKNFRSQYNVKKFSQKHLLNKRLKIHENGEVEERDDYNDNYNEKYESSNKPYQSRESGNLNFKSNRNQESNENIETNEANDVVQIPDNVNTAHKKTDCKILAVCFFMVF